jgi:hypothetical protein
VGAQFIVTGPVPRLVVFFVASVAHATIFLGLSVILDVRVSGVPSGTILGQAVGNAIIGGVAFQLADGFPGFVERRRAMRGRGKRR